MERTDGSVKKGFLPADIDDGGDEASRVIGDLFGGRKEEEGEEQR